MGTLTGLANLNIRIGFSTTWHIVAAFVDSLFFKDKAIWLMPIISYLATFGYFSWEYLNSEKIWIKLYSAINIFWIFINVYTWGFPSLHYDFISLVYHSILIFKILKIELKYKECDYSDLYIIFIFATASFLIKPMAAVSVLFSCCYITFKLLKTLKLKPHVLIKVYSLPAIAFIAWLSRNIVLSGWPLFPNPVLGLNVDWKTSYINTLTAYKEIKAWARMPIPELQKAMVAPFSVWFPFWVKNNFTSTRFILLAIVPTLIALNLLGMKFKILFKNRSFIFLFVWHIAALLFWFVIAPDIRFGDGFFITISSLIICYSLKNYSLEFSKVKFDFLFFSYVFFLSFACIALLVVGKRGPVSFFTTGKHNSGPVIKKQNIINGNVVFEAWMPVSVEECYKESISKICPNETDAKLYTPLQFCSNSPLPCMPSYDENLRFRNNKDYQDGFKLFDSK
ncbi:MAG: hypothetical protein COW79_04410 [Bdellovibrionales bacterium CG22_combo_CG10-13_8_21_14_all_38_13]|nr:MAG: hypothetical protein COW79_04410 [Bdellovibrionales bacterium CG22_combo_CG10-13_8_21_14_all_38_13]